MPLYSFVCSKGHSVELVRPLGQDAVVCQKCGHTAERAHVYHIHVVGPTVDTRGMYRRFSEATQEWDHAVGKTEVSVGHEITSPNLWRAAKAKADALTATGESFKPADQVRRATNAFSG